MAIHKRREESGRAAARLLLESTEPVELPPAEIDEQDATVEREEFRQYLPELLDALEEGGWADPAPDGPKRFDLRHRRRDAFILGQAVAHR